MRPKLSCNTPAVVVVVVVLELRLTMAPSFPVRLVVPEAEAVAVVGAERSHTPPWAGLLAEAEEEAAAQVAAGTALAEVLLQVE